jgi:predicted enzyme related to lactoylglutathione lyase
MTPARHAIDWFEIPVRDMDRAAAFYEALLATTIRREHIAPHALGVIKYDASAVGGCLIQGDDVPAPSTAGTLVYLNAGPSLDTVLARVEPAGGRITTPKVTLPGDMGCFAHITDSEGNRVGLHAPV